MKEAEKLGIVFFRWEIGRKILALKGLDGIYFAKMPEIGSP